MPVTLGSATQQPGRRAGESPQRLPRHCSRSAPNLARPARLRAFAHTLREEGAMRGLKVPLSPNEEVTLRRIAIGSPTVLSVADVARFKQLELIEIGVGATWT